MHGKNPLKKVLCELSKFVSLMSLSFASLLKMPRAFYRICWGQALIQLHIKDLKAIEESSSSCPFTSCRSWISSQPWFGEQHIFCLMLSVTRCLILLQGVLPGDSRGRYFYFCFITTLATACACRLRQREEHCKIKTPSNSWDVLYSQHTKDRTPSS